jgi:hypothetical protein
MEHWVQEGLTEETEELGQMLPQRESLHQELHVNFSGIELGPPRWEACH